MTQSSFYRRSAAQPLGRKRRQLLCGIFVVCIAVLICVFATIANLAPTYAATDPAAAKKIYQKALLNGLKTCYNKTYMVETIAGNKFNTGSDKTDNLLTYQGKSKNIILVPSGLKNTSDSPKITCKETFDNLAKLTGKKSAIQKLEEPTKLGYNSLSSSTPSSDSTVEKCASIKYKVVKGGISHGEEQTNRVCFQTGVGDKLVLSEEPQVEKGDHSGGSDVLAFSISGLGDDRTVIISADGFTPARISGLAGMSWSGFMSALKTIEIVPKDGDRVEITDVVETVKVDDKGHSTEKTFKLDSNGQHGALNAARFFLGKSDITWDDNSIGFTRRNTFDLGMLYINKYIEDSSNKLSVDYSKCGTKSAAKKASDSGHAYHKSKDVWCPLSGVDSVADIEVNMIVNPTTKDGVSHTMKSMNVKRIIAIMQDDNFDDLGQGAGNAAGESKDDDDDSDDGSEQPNCFNAAKTLGWILCPVIQGAGNAVEGIYDDIIKPNFLELDAKTLMANDGGVREAWKQFRDFANILFVILLAVVILSQLTGIGISNYGVKKILPRLVMIAVLVNLSFVLCQLAVDVSNILGRSLETLFKGFAADSAITLSDMVGGTLKGLFATGASVGLSIAGVSIAISTWEYWLFPVLILFLGLIIGVFFFAIILGVRQAGIIILVALTPVAIICYALPNTKKLFDKWFKLFSSLLIVYPVAGALMGGGIWASNLLLSTGKGDKSFFFALIAMLLQVVPFFFIPTLVKQSLSVAGNLGAKISGIGDRVSRGSTKAIRSSNRYKDTQERMIGHNAERRLDPWYNRQNGFARVVGAPRRAAARAGERIRSGNGRIARMANNSYNRRQSRLVDTAVKQRAANQNAMFMTQSGLENAERRLDSAMVKNFQETYESNRDFMNDLGSQEAEYRAAVDAVEADPTNQQAVSNLRALQNVLMKTDKGQGIVQNEMNRRFYDEQQANGANAQISSGMRTVAQTLMQDHGGAMKSNSRSMYNLANDAASGKTNEVFKGSYTQDTNNGNAMYYNSKYDQEGADKWTAATLAGASEDALKRIVNSAQDTSSNGMADDTLNDYAKIATEALTDPRQKLSKETRGYLNSILAAKNDRDAEQFKNANTNNLFDDQGRTFTHAGGNNYEHKDENGTIHKFTRNASTGKMTEVGGSGETIDAAHIMNANQKADKEFQFTPLEAGDSVKIKHTPEKKISLPPGWQRRADGKWINTKDGFRELNAAEIVRAETYERHNAEVETRNAAAKANENNNNP